MYYEYSMCADNKTTVQAQMFANRLQKRFRHLKKWAKRCGAGAFRLYDRDIPEVPLVLDFYGDTDQPQDAALAVALYKRPYEKDEADENQWLCAMKEAASSVMRIAPDRIFLKQRRRQRGVSQYEKMDNRVVRKHSVSEQLPLKNAFSQAESRENAGLVRQPTGLSNKSNESFMKIVSEGNLSFKVNLSDYLDTGLFPDRRLLRGMVRNEANGKRVLNLFSYTGLFSVYAASGGAVSTDSIDLSNTYLHWARENFSLNGLSASLLQQYDFFSDSKMSQNCANKLIRADVLGFLEKAVSQKLLWDIIILDPPAFSNSAKMTESFDLLRDMVVLLQQCIDLLAPAGKIFLSVNTKRFKVSPEQLGHELAPDKTGIKVTDLTNRVIDEDFRGRKTPGSFLIEKAEQVST